MAEPQSGSRIRRASVACAACRARRVRCFIDRGQTRCDHCVQHDLQCLLRDDHVRKTYANSHQTWVDRRGSDESRPAKSRARSLRDRIAALESLLNEQNEANSTALDECTNLSRARAQSDRGSPWTTRESQKSNHWSPRSIEYSLMDDSGPSELSPLLVSDPSQPFAMQATDLGAEYTIGPFPVEAASIAKNSATPKRPSPLKLTSAWAASIEENDDNAHRLITGLPPALHDHLMDNYWSYYNSVVQVSNTVAFYDDKEAGRAESYSILLHICMLAIGLRYEDRLDRNVNELTKPGGESILHREARRLADSEIEKPDEVSSVQALLLMADLEFGVGRYKTAWMYADLACRICLDIGLHTECDRQSISERTIQVRSMTLWACVAWDKFWTLFLGRPTCFKVSGLKVSRRTRNVGNSSTAGVGRIINTKIYLALLELMDIAVKVIEHTTKVDNPSYIDNYHVTMSLHDELQTWYNNLPAELTWNRRNFQEAPSSYFLLHQQYYAILITLHCPIAFDNSPLSSASAKSPCEFSRNACRSYAIHMSRIFNYHQQRFHVKNIFATGIQHAATAASALIGLIPLLDKSEAQKEARFHLLRLDQVLKASADIYVPAKRMHNALNDAIQRCGFDNSNHPELRHDFCEKYGMNQGLSSHSDSNANSILFNAEERLITMPSLRDEIESLNGLDQRSNISSQAGVCVEENMNRNLDLDSLLVTSDLYNFEGGYELDGVAAGIYSWDFGGCDSLNTEGGSFSFD